MHTKEKRRILKIKVMTREELLIEKRTSLINQLIELNVWAMENKDAKTTEAILQIENQLDELANKIERLRNE